VIHSDEVPRKQSDQTATEAAYWNAFKAIEALAGEPGNEQRFRERLVAMGINPDEPVGLREQLPLIRRIREVHRTRDARAGHGHRSKTHGSKPIAYRELLDAQVLAHACIFLYLDHRGAFVTHDFFVWPERRET
jgi:hypothetical protein